MNFAVALTLSKVLLDEGLYFKELGCAGLRPVNRGEATKIRSASKFLPVLHVRSLSAEFCIVCIAGGTRAPCLLRAYLLSE